MQCVVSDSQGGVHLARRPYTKTKNKLQKLVGRIHNMFSRSHTEAIWL